MHRIRIRKKTDGRKEERKRRKARPKKEQRRTKGCEGQNDLRNAEEQKMNSNRKQVRQKGKGRRIDVTEPEARFSVALRPQKP